MARILPLILVSPLTSAFLSQRPRLPRFPPLPHALVDIDYNAPRDIGTFLEWSNAMGIQQADGLQLTSDDDGVDIFAMTTQDVPANTPVLMVPNNLVLSCRTAMQEIGRLENAEERLVSAKASDHVPHFYLFLYILREYERGDQQSPYYPWLNSLPRYYSNGASMTPFCFDCLPPFTGRLARQERVQYLQFYQALKYVDFLSQSTTTSKALTKWVFAVVYTRGFATPDGDFQVAPFADFFNHHADPEVSLQYDKDGNTYIVTTKDVPAGSPLRLQYADPTNPSHLLARYGFLDESSPATFCKLMYNNNNKPTTTTSSAELRNLGYDHSRLLFYRDGSVSPEVWNVLLYQALAQSNPDAQDAFYQACVTGDTDTQQSIHNYFVDTTRAALQDHVESFLRDLWQLNSRCAMMNVDQHPRLPLIVRHNQFVLETFLAVQERQQLGVGVKAAAR